MARKTKQAQSEYLQRYIDRCWEEADDATTERRSIWSELWEAYKCRQDYKFKASWQSKIFVPKVFMVVERGSAEVRRAFQNTQKLFKLDLDDSDERAKMSMVRAAMLKEPGMDIRSEVARLESAAQNASTQEEASVFQAQAKAIQAKSGQNLGSLRQQWLDLEQDLKQQEIQRDVDEARFRADLAKTNLGPVYGEMTKSAFLLGLGVHKVGWSRSQSSVAFRHVDAMNMAVAPDWEPSTGDEPEYLIERTKMRLSRLYDLAETANKESGRNLYDMDAIRSLDSAGVSEEQQEEDERRGISPRAAGQRSKTVELRYFWGDIPNEDEHGYSKRKQFVVEANNRTIIRTGPNPFDHGKAPYILTMPISYPHRGISGVSIVEYVVKLNYVFNNVLNLFVDNLNFTVNKQYQGDPNLLANPQASTAIYPGKFWKLKPGATGLAITEIPTGQMGSDAPRMLSMIDKELQEATSVTEFLQGMPGSQEKTLGEIQLKTMQSQGLFDVIGKELEQNSIKPTLDMSWDLYQQFAGYPSRAGKYTVAVGGVSLMLTARQLMESIAVVFGMAMKSPQLLQRLDVDYLWQRLLSVHGLGDAYVEPKGGSIQLTPEQGEAVTAKAEQDAHVAVQNMLAGEGQQQPVPSEQVQP